MLPYEKATTAVAGHFGELLQGRMGRDGPVVLVTLPCNELSVHGWYRAAQEWHIQSPDRLVSLSAARQFFEHLGISAAGHYTLRADMPTQAGCGASTAALIALAKLATTSAQNEILPDEIAAACLAVEGASDPLMFDRPERYLWASRQGKLVDNLPNLPKFEVLGGFFGEPVVTRPEDMDFADISDLIPLWKTAANDHDLLALAQLSSCAATRTLQRRGADNDPTIDLVDRLGAMGCVVAHTGTARGMIFAPGTVPKNGADVLRSAGLRGVLQFMAGGVG